MTTRPITVAETLPFLRQAASLWDEDERNAFVDYIARNPEAGDVIPDSAAFARCDGAGRAPASVAACA